MALSPSDLLTLVNQITGRSETDLTNYLRNVVHDLEAKSVFLEGETTFSLTAGDEDYALSSIQSGLFRRPIHLQPIDSSSNVYHELTERSYEWFRERKVYNSGNGKPTDFAIWNDTIYLWRKPSSTYTTMKIWGRLNHSDTVTSISYPEKFRKVIVAGCSWYVFERYGLTDTQKAKDQKAIYDDQLDMQISRKANERGHVAAYNDL